MVDSGHCDKLDWIESVSDGATRLLTQKTGPVSLPAVAFGGRVHAPQVHFSRYRKWSLSGN